MLYERARENMVEGQIRPNKVTDARILNAFRKVPREIFVPANLQGVAYTDEEIEVGPGRCLMKPMVLARMVQSVGIGPDDVVLNIGCRTGYSTAILGELAGTVLSIEQDAVLAKNADDALRGLDICNLAVIQAPLSEGYPRQAPYDVIFVGGAVSSVPFKILNQLAEGGRLIAVLLGEKGRGVGVATLFTRKGDTFSEQALFDAAASFMPGFSSSKETFSF